MTTLSSRERQWIIRVLTADKDRALAEAEDRAEADRSSSAGRAVVGWRATTKELAQFWGRA